MKELCDKAETFVTEIVADLDFDLEVEAVWSDEEGCLIDLSGGDSHFTLSDNGEMLDAFETLLFQIYGREIERKHRFICDSDGYRQTRKSELNLMAKFGANNVREKGVPFTFGVLTSTERRMIHLCLQDEVDLLTESVGEGSDRRLRIRRK